MNCKYRLVMVAIAAAGIASGAACASAHDLTFRDIEFNYPSDERIDVARKTFGAELPVGTPIARAQAVLHKADARCRPAKDFQGLLCHFGMFDAPENHLHDIYWTVRVTAQAGLVNGLTIDRESRGS